MGLDFMEVCTKIKKVKGEGSKDILEVYPSFKVGETKDLMIRGHDAYAIWDEENKTWLEDEIKMISLIDKQVYKKVSELKSNGVVGFEIKPLYLRDTENRMIKVWHDYVRKDMPDIYMPLDSKIIFDDHKSVREDYATKSLPYHLNSKTPKAYQELTSVLYSQEELMKIEWCIGAILSGDSSKIQKFLVITGDAGSGKSTMLNIMQMLFDGYYISFDSKALVGNNQFGLSQFKTNPRVAIEHDGNLSRIWDNSKLNSLISHEEMMIDEKYHSPYPMKFDTFLVIASNLPVDITDAKSGLTRRIIDAEPTGNRIKFDKYNSLMEQIKFELGSIANHCLDVYSTNKHYYDKYRPTKQIAKTYKFYDYIEYMSQEFEDKDYTTLDYAWGKYKKYVDLASIKFPYDRIRFKTELMEFFEEFYSRRRYEGGQYRNIYIGYRKDRLSSSITEVKTNDVPEWLNLAKYIENVLDKDLQDRPAQYAKEDGSPLNSWDYVRTILKDIQTSRLHYILVPENYIVIDFDIRDEKGDKSLEKNIEVAKNFPPTYAEVSQSGKGLHLHYIYDGDVSKLSSVYDVNVEVKVYRGRAALRRKLTLCNNIPIATISSGLPLKEETKVVNKEAVQSERGLRKLILRNLNKEIHPGTKPSVDFIFKILDDAYKSGLNYDVSDMYPAIETFAMHSTHQAGYCVKLVSKMKFKSDEPSENVDNYDSDKIVYFDVEVFPNLFIVCHKIKGEGAPTKMINPTAEELEPLLNYRLVGFNNRRYDNHILYARIFGGYDNEQLFKLSQRIINNSENAMFGEAYNLSYADIYEYSSKKQSLKKWEIQLGIFHLENAYPWDQPVAEEHWNEIADYCANDVIATEAVAEACHQDFVAREILATLSGLTVGHTTRQHAQKIIFGDDKHPELVYTDLSELFPGYEFKDGKSYYMGEEVGEGGYVYAEPGYYEHTGLFDIQSMHPNSIRELNLFGDEYTKNFTDILDARIAIKHHDFEAVRNMFDGALMQFLSTDEDADALAYALKIIINSVYGFTTANFDNVFKDPRNVDNIVAKRGALFMVTLKHEVQKRGYTVAHIKTDSIKIPDYDEDIKQFIMEYGKKYGYIFEHEATYEKMCLVNDAVYIAKYEDGAHKFKLPTGEKIETPWTATGTQFQVPYVFKTLFSKTPIIFNDMCETKSVTSSLYLDFNETLPEGEHDYRFVGRVGKFTPVKANCGGALLLREKDGKYYAATGSKGYRWMESNMVIGHEDDIDLNYYRSLVDAAKTSIEVYCDIDEFIK